MQIVFINTHMHTYKRVCTRIYVHVCVCKRVYARLSMKEERRMKRKRHGVIMCVRKSNQKYILNLSEYKHNINS